VRTLAHHLLAALSKAHYSVSKYCYARVPHGPASLLAASPPHFPTRRQQQLPSLLTGFWISFLLPPLEIPDLEQPLFGLPKFLDICKPIF
jgi:hypothetical protein